MTRRSSHWERVQWGAHVLQLAPKALEELQVRGELLGGEHGRLHPPLHVVAPLTNLVRDFVVFVDENLERPGRVPQQQATHS